MYHDTFSDIMYNYKTRHHIKNTDNLPVWVIGDVHGCGDQYEELLEKVVRETNGECLIFQLGDLVDRGPDLYKVFEINKRFGVLNTLGNHELNFILEHFNYKRCSSKERKKNHDRLTYLKDTHQEFVISEMLKMQNYYTVDVDGTCWFLSHAPFKANKVLFEDCGNASLYCMNSVPYNNSPLNNNCVHGHQHWNYTDIQEQIDNNEQGWYNVDSGGVYGNEIIALELGTLSVLRVNGANYAKLN